MTFEEQMRIIELKELDSADQRKVFTKLVCVYFEPKDMDINCLAIEHSPKKSAPIEKISTSSDIWSKPESLMNGEVCDHLYRSVSVSNIEGKLHQDMQGQNKIYLDSRRLEKKISKSYSFESFIQL